jgi:hypothetical protein
VYACCSTFSFLLRTWFLTYWTLFVWLLPFHRTIGDFLFSYKIVFVDSTPCCASCHGTEISAWLLGWLQIGYETHDVWWML